MNNEQLGKFSSAEDDHAQAEIYAQSWGGYFFDSPCIVLKQKGITEEFICVGCKT